jgi:tetratricopeptide (TPR) repeat protein
MSTAAQLNDEGNQLFSAKQYAQAQRVYGQAIEKNPSNPIIYTNRAACPLNLKQHVRRPSNLVPFADNR